MANQSTENLFNAIDEIISSRISSLNYDRTIKAVVINADQADRGIYEVSEIGSEKTNPFKAYSKDSIYQKNDYVYVTIPEGDMTAENKIIIGKYIEDGDAYYNYVNPMDQFLDITGNLITQLGQTEFGIIANHEPHKEIRLWESTNSLNLRGFDRLALKGEFKTWLQSSDIFSGTYGLVLVVQSSSGEFYPFSLTSREMYGNPYYFETFYKQEILLDIGKIDEIDAMWLSLVQCNDFLLSDGSFAPEAGSPNIFLKAPYISVGYDISNFDGDDLRISSDDDLDWNGKEDPVEKTIKAKWIHVAEGASAIVVDDETEIPRNPNYKDNTELVRYAQPLVKADIRWFQHVDSYSSDLANKINEIEADMEILQARINEAMAEQPNEESTGDIVDIDVDEEMSKWPEMTESEMRAQLEDYEKELAELLAFYADKNLPADDDNLNVRRYTGYKHTGRNWVEIQKTLDENFNPKNQFTYTFTTPIADTTTPALRFKAVMSVPSERYVNAQFVLTDAYTTLLDCKDIVEKNAAALECFDYLHEVMDGTMTLTNARKKINEIYNNNGGMSQSCYHAFGAALTSYATARSEIQHIESQELAFPNLGYYPDKYKDDIANLQVIVDPNGLKGQYLIYDDSGLITDETEADTERYCEAVYTTLAGVLNTEYSSMQDFTYQIDSTELICWFIPLDNTMIAPPTSSYGYTLGANNVVEDYLIDNVNGEDGIPPGHYCKIERVPQREKTEVSEEELIAEHYMCSRQPFKIKDYYTQMETNNFIYCRVTKNNKNYIAKGTMAFGINGTNGTNSTFIIRTYEINEDGSISDVPTTALSLQTTRQVENLNGDVVKRITGYGEIGLVPELYDYNNQLLADYFKDPAHPVKYSFKSDSETVPFDIRLEPNGCAIVSWSGIYKDLNDLTEDFYLVVEAEVPYKITYNFETYTQEDLQNDPALVELGRQIGDYKLDEQGNKIPAENSRTRDDYLKVFTPISIVTQKLLRQEKKVSGGDKITTILNPKDYQRQVLGANRVIYDRNGSNAKYYKDPYQLFDSLLEEVEDIEWSARITASFGKAGAEKASIESFYPAVTPSGILQPLEMFILGTDSTDGIPGNFCVQGGIPKRDADGNIMVDAYGQVIYDEILCIQPVLIMQNKYGSSMLNKWDGGLTIDEKNGTILAAMVGAGIKDTNNTFSGVLMGDVTQAFKDNHNGLGLYGFHQSDQSFGFNVDGTAFIGKAGHGRITFDGNEGIIQSGAYSDGYSEKYKVLDGTSIRPAQGMQIDLDGSDGISASLKAFGSAGGFVLDTKGHPEFKDKYNANYVPKHLRPTETDSGVLTDEDIQSYSKYSYDEDEGKYIHGDGIVLPVTFKLFTGTYNNRPNPNAALGQFYNPNLPRERGMIYFDVDGQYIQSTNYNGYYDTAKTIYPEGLDEQKNPPGWYEANGTEPSHSPATRGTFIDLKNGWIDTRSGIIGGWKITQYSLSSMKDEIILSTGNPKASDIMHQTPYIQIGKDKQIFVSPGNSASSNADEHVPHIRIGAIDSSTGKMMGNFWIADYKISAATVKGASISNDAIQVSNAIFSIPSLEDGNDSVSDYIDALSYSSMNMITETTSLDALNHWQLLDDTRANKMGIQVETAKSSSGSKQFTIFRPVDSTAALLGTKTDPWHYAYIKNGLYIYESFSAFTDSKEASYQGQTIEGWHYIATQPWITNVIVPLLQKRMKQINALYWYRTEKLIKGLEALSGVCKTVVTNNGDQASIETLAYTITTEKTITVSGPASTGKTTVPTLTAFTQYKQDMLQWQIRVNNDMNDMNSKINALESFVANHSHAGFLTGLPSHSHSVSGTDSMGGSISGTAS